MLSIFAYPKPFQGHIATIQRNAIGSWLRLSPPCQILLFGDEEGTAVVAKEFGVCHVPDVMRNEYGTPFLNDVFRKAERLARHDLLCYVNSDIILGSDFIPAIQQVRQWRPRFLTVGECWNLDVTEPVIFDRPMWEENLKALLQQRGTPRGLESIDYFVFSRGLYGNLPPFALGRAWFDSWLIWKARDLKAAVVDVSSVIAAIHQNHDYSHVSGGKEYVLRGKEAMHNLQLAGGPGHCYKISEATYKFLPAGIRRSWVGYFSPKRKEQFWYLVNLTRPLRHAFGINMRNALRVRAFLARQK